MCIFTGDDCKFSLWKLEEDKSIQEQLAKHQRRTRTKVHRGKFSARRNLKLNKKPGIISLTKHKRPEKKKPKPKPDDDNDHLTGDDDEDPTEENKAKGLLPKKDPYVDLPVLGKVKKKKFYWALIISGIVLVLLAVSFLFLCMRCN